MKAFLDRSRSKNLFGRIERSRQALAALEDGSSEQRDAARALDALYAELGNALYKYVSIQAELDDETVDDDDTHQGSILLMDHEEEDERDPPTLKRMAPLGLAAFGAETFDDDPEVTNVGVGSSLDEYHAAVLADDPTEERSTTGEHTDGYVQSARLSDGRPELDTEPRPLPHVQSSGWIGQLRDLLSTMPLPQRWDNVVEVSTEAALVQWCTVDLNRRWADYPPAIQIALLGLMSSRARFLQERLGVPAGPQLALQRLRAFRKEHQLSPVVGLLKSRGPEYTEWNADARYWWGVLVDGISA